MLKVLIVGMAAAVAGFAGETVRVETSGTEFSAAELSCTNTVSGKNFVKGCGNVVSGTGNVVYGNNNVVSGVNNRVCGNGRVVSGVGGNYGCP